MTALNEMNDDQISRQRDRTQQELADEEARIRAAEAELMRSARSQETPNLAKKA
jgi:hypothetical protein